MNDNPIRLPDAYVNPDRGRKTKKWERIISLFMESELSELVLSHRTGTRGRILSVLAQEAFHLLRMPFKAEPIFIHKKPKRWYVDFARSHNIKPRTHVFYNPDLFFEDGTWAEITLSENTAYKKLFRYGHQADKLAVFWLDQDTGLHKEICRSVRFPNARVMSIECLYPQLETVSGGPELVERLLLLKGLKGILL